MNWLNNVFNNITVTGNVEFNDGFLSNGDGTFTSSPGLFLYGPGAPAAGNLILSVTSTAGTDVFGNNYVGDGETTYDNVNAVALTNQGATLQFYTMTQFNPGAGFTPGGLINNINGTSFIQMSQTLIVDTTGTGPLTLESSVGSVTPLNPDGNGFLSFKATSGIGNSDGNQYRCGEFYVAAHGIPITNGFSTFLAIPVCPGPIYDIDIVIGYAGNQNAGVPVIGWHGGLVPEASYGETDFGFVQNAVYNNAVPGDRTGPTLQNGAAQLYHTRITYALPATQTGSLVMAASVSGAGDSMNILFAQARVRSASQ